MSRVKNRITAYIKENLKHEDQFDNIKNKLDLHIISKKEEKYSFMKNRRMFKIIFPCVLLLICVITGIALISIKSPTTTPKPVAVVQMNVNPSISFVLDDENTVVSVYGENDEGKMIITDVEIIGLKLELAIEKILTIENETGYLISGNIETEKNTITFNIESDDESIIDGLEDKINDYVTSTCEKLNIKENVQFIKNKTKEQLVKRAMELDPTLTLEQANAKTSEELILYISGCQLEKIDIPTEDLEQLYDNFKLQQINLVEKEETKKFIDSLDSTYQSIIKNYDELYNNLISAQQQMNDKYVSLFISETSTYQQCLRKCQEQKLEVLKLENEISNMEDSPNKILLQQTLKAKNMALDAQIKTLEITKKATEQGLQLVNEAFNYVLVQMDEFKASLPEEIKTKMEKNLENLEDTINETKENMIVEFENKYKSTIENAYNNAKNYKQQLIESMKK